MGGLLSRCGGKSSDSASTPPHTHELMAAASLGDVEALRAVLAAGADVNACDREGWTALTAAAWYGRVDAIKALLEAGASVNHEDALGQTPLLFAAGKAPDAIVALVEAGADVHHASNRGYTAMTAAAGTGHVQVSRHRRLLQSVTAQLGIPIGRCRGR
jgi:ankyrin repeat protein